MQVAETLLEIGFSQTLHERNDPGLPIGSNLVITSAEKIVVAQVLWLQNSQSNGRCIK